ncbi:AmmeMemoRadiSam system protein B [candidate division KSB1 bacterium]|nr:AmmeMemoRadiSam system protein B [candidate division KSB1 bacterium]
MKAKKTLILIFSLMLVGLAGAQKIRPPKVAGQFYPRDPQELKQTLMKLMENAPELNINGEIKALIVPHAGYQFSAAVAAAGFRQVQGQKYETILVIAPSHHDAFTGASIYDGEGYRTPLGVVKIDQNAAGRLFGASNYIQKTALGHGEEHAIEVELPFIQYLFPGTPVIPIVIGRYNWDVCEKVGTAIANVFKGKKILLVASTDLYHGDSYDDCKSTDQRTLDAMAAFYPKSLCDGFFQGKYSACGGGPVVIVQVAARQMGADVSRILAHANSADVTGKKIGYTVGYGAVAVYKSNADKSGKIEYPPLKPEVQKELIKMARESIKYYLEHGSRKEFTPIYDVMNEKRGVFVTLNKYGVLRGCIGHHTGDKPLYELVPEMAIAAAFQDPRFDRLEKHELRDIKIKVSVYLTNVYPIKTLDEFIMGEHGIIMQKNGRSATFLPEVPLEVGWKTKEEEMAQLCAKAGLPPNAWKTGANFWVYKTQVFGEDTDN